ncbi:MAG: hypothetical protein ABI578_07210 [Chloroflexota bacterium]
MNARRLVSLYPEPWRHRYGEEFLALLEDRPPGTLQIVDIAWGALDAHLFPQTPEGRFRMFTRVAGLAGVGAGVALAIGFLGYVLPGINAYTVPTFYVLVLLATIGLHLRQVSLRPPLAWLGFAAGVAGFGIGIANVVLSTAGVLPPSGGEFGFVAGFALWVGSIVLGATVLAIGRYPMAAGLALTIGASLAMIGLSVGRAEATADMFSIVSQAGILLYAAGWVGVGAGLLTAQPQEGVLGPA